MAELHSRLEPFLLLARTTKGAAAVKVVLDATAASGVYVFSELLELPNIKELANDPAFEKQYRLLELFAYGSLNDYATAPDSYPPLTPAHQAKLKHLSLVSLALQRRSLPYADISASLRVESTRELENLIIDVMYADLLGGKMYHHEQMFHVDWVAGRDVSPQGLKKVQHGLESWCQNAQTLLSALDEQIAAVREQTIREAEDNARYARQRDEAYLAATDQRKGKGKSAEKNWEAMELDDEDGDRPPNFFGESAEGRMRSSSQRSFDSLGDVASQRAKKRKD